MRRIICFHIGMILMMIAGFSATHRCAATTLTLAHYLDYEPYAYVDQGGRSRGMLVDIWRLWAEKNEVELAFVPAGLNRGLELVKNGEADLFIGLFESPERAVHLDFSDPLIGAVDIKLYVEETLNVTAAEALGGIPVGVIRDDYAEDYLRQRYPGLKLKAFSNSKEIITQAVGGKLAAFVLDAQNATYLLAQHNALTRFKPVSRLYNRVIRAGVRKGDERLIGLINQGLKKISRKEREAIYADYGSFSPQPLIARYRFWFLGAAAALLTALLIVAFYYFRLRKRIDSLPRDARQEDSGDWMAVIGQGRAIPLNSNPPCATSEPVQRPYH